MGSGIGSAVRVAAAAVSAVTQRVLASARGAVGGPIAFHNWGTIAAYQWCRIHRRRHSTGLQIHSFIHTYVHSFIHT
jgi:hypothetical protein